VTRNRIARLVAGGLTTFAITTASVVALPATASAATACSDGFDNDRDGNVDYPADPGCASPADATEGAPCTLGVCVGISARDVIESVHVRPDEVVPGSLLVVAGYVDLYRFTLPNGAVVNLPCAVLEGTAGGNPCAMAGGSYVSRTATLVRDSVDVDEGPEVATAGLCTGELQATADDIGIASAPAYTLC
jgi:hypothetical protein